MKQGEFFNTTSLKGEELKVAKRKAGSQETKIHKFLKDHKDTWYTSFDLHEILFSENTPHTSIRRCLTNLFNDGSIYKSNGAEKVGLYGANVHCWKFKK